MNMSSAAYAHGFATKLAEYGVSPSEFIQAAQRSGVPELHKAASMLLNSRALNGVTPTGALASAGILGLSAAGMYGFGNADTVSNDMKRFSNKNLGTQFDLQSRLSNAVADFDNPYADAAAHHATGIYRTDI
jgi:hypothetical protein